jgi:hypothetical protein
VYIATSDDTMMPEGLEKMVLALDANPDCGLCQCELVIIDENGVPYPPARQWGHYTLGTYDQNIVLNKNKRMAPHDGVLHPALFTIYTSITQLLIRRKVFDRLGPFDGCWGAISDFEWGMRVGLVENCIYIPEKLATWRLHPGQATQDVHTLQNRLKMIDMARAAFARARACEGSRLREMDINDLVYFLERDVVEFGYKATKGRTSKLCFLAKQLLQYPGPVVDHIVDFLHNNKWDSFNCANRYGRLKYVLEKYHITSPHFG